MRRPTYADDYCSLSVPITAVENVVFSELFSDRNIVSIDLLKEAEAIFGRWQEKTEGDKKKAFREFGEVLAKREERVIVRPLSTLRLVGVQAVTPWVTLDCDRHIRRRAPRVHQVDVRCHLSVSLIALTPLQDPGDSGRSLPRRPASATAPSLSTSNLGRRPHDVLL